MCFVFIWEQTANCATFSINWLVFITEMKSVYSAVRTGSLNKAVSASSLLGKPNQRSWRRYVNISNILFPLHLFPHNPPYSEGNRPLGRPRRRWVDGIRMDLLEVGCGYMDWIGLAQDTDSWRTLVSAVMNLRVPWNAGNFLTCCKPVSFSRRTVHHGVSK